MVIAARNGHDKVVHALITKFGHAADDVLDLNVTGSVVLAGHLIEGATALWAAACAGHLKVVKTLVKAGADVNKVTQSHSTPLRAACYGGHTEVVRFLLSKAADVDVNLSNKFDNTCLMIAAFKGHREIVRLLLENGAKVNAGAKCGSTALHFAAEEGYLPIVKLLVEVGGADVNVVDSHGRGMTPVLGAAHHCRDQVVDYLLPLMRPHLDDDDDSEENGALAFEAKADKIEVLELLGASFANSHVFYDLEKAYYYLEKGMQLRWSDEKCPVLKPATDPVPAYDSHVECSCLEDLEAIRNDPEQLHMEGLAIRERILGSGNTELLTPIQWRGAHYADEGNYERCILLWLHALNLKTNMRARVDREIVTFVELFCQILSSGKTVKFDDFVVVFRAAKDSLTCMSEYATDTSNCCGDDQEGDGGGAGREGGGKSGGSLGRERAELMSNDFNLREDCVLYLMRIFLCLTNLFTKIKSFSDDQRHTVMTIIHEVVEKVEPKSRTKRTLLHLAVDSETTVNDWGGTGNGSGLLQFPCAATAKVLLEVGGDAKAADADFNTPLHVIVGYRKIVSDFQTLHTIVALLVGAGAHCDVVNAQGQTPMAKAATGVVQIILKIHDKINLKCLSARAVKRHRLQYKNQVPKDLEAFVDMHGP